MDVNADAEEARSRPSSKRLLGGEHGGWEFAAGEVLLGGLYPTFRGDVEGVSSGDWIQKTPDEGPGPVGARRSFGRIGPERRREAVRDPGRDAPGATTNRAEGGGPSTSSRGSARKGIGRDFPTLLADGRFFGKRPRPGQGKRFLAREGSGPMGALEKV